MPKQPAVLIVDDEGICLTVTAEMVKKFGLPTMTAGDGLTAVEIFQRHGATIGCVLLDLQMPEMDGIEAFRRIRKIDANVQVVIVSGYLNGQIRELLEPLHPAGYMKKPLSYAGLSDLLRRLLPA